MDKIPHELWCGGIDIRVKVTGDVVAILIIAIIVDIVIVNQQL